MIPDRVHQLFIDPAGAGGAPPPDMLEGCGLWARHHPGIAHRIWDLPDALALLAAGGQAAAVDAIHACRLPAMQADLVRLGIVFLEGGWWADLRVVPRGPCLGDLAEASLVLVADHPGDRRARLTNRLFGAAPRHPAIGRLLAEAVGNVASRRQGSVIALTGSGLLDSAAGLAGADSRLLPEAAWEERFDLRQASYNRPGQHWSQREQAESLYR